MSLVGFESGVPVSRSAGLQLCGSSFLTQVPLLKVLIAWLRSAGLHGAGGLTELGVRRAFPSISDAQSVLIWVESWTLKEI